MRAAAITASLIRLCIRYGVSYTLENPAGSQLFSYPPIQRIADRLDSFLVRVDYCMFGCCYQKATSLLTNIASLKELECTCDRQHQHLQLAGTGANHVTGKQIWRTTVSGRYPPLLCQEWARLIARSLPASAVGRDAADVECQDLHLALCAAHNAKDCIIRPKCPSGPVLEWDIPRGGWGETWRHPKRSGYAPPSTPLQRSRAASEAAQRGLARLGRPSRRELLVPLAPAPEHRRELPPRSKPGDDVGRSPAS